MATITPYSAANLIADTQVDPERWSRVPDEATNDRTVSSIEARRVPRGPGRDGRRGEAGPARPDSRRPGTTITP